MDLRSMLTAQEAAVQSADKELKETADKLEEYRRLIEKLTQLSERFEQEQLVKLTANCLMRGTVYHTSEVTVALGCGYYARTSTKNSLRIAQLRVDRLQARASLLQARRQSAEENRQLLLGMGAEAQGASDISEAYSQEAESEWRLRHREAVRRQKREEKAARDQMKGSSDAEMWARLDELERQETDDGGGESAAKETRQRKSVSFAGADCDERITYSSCDPPSAEAARRRTITFRHSSSRPTTAAAAAAAGDGPAPLFRSPADIGVGGGGVAERRSAARAPPVRDTVVERPPVRDAVVERLPVRDTVVERPPVRDAVVERPPVRDAVVERPPVRDAVVERPPVRDAVVERPPAAASASAGRPVSRFRSQRQQSAPCS